jgi:hypothetical protein
MDTLEFREAMRNWLLDCYTTEDEQEEINELSLPQLMNAVERYYDGGLRQFYITFEEDQKACKVQFNPSL